MILSATLRNTIALAIESAINLGAAGGKIKARTGATPGAGTLLATWTFDVDAGSVSGAVFTGATFPNEVNAVATGTIGNVEITDSDDTVCLQTADVGTGAEQVSFSSLACVNGQPVRINTLTITVPAGT
jgi:hypothetical protein